jgi:hypothetical protein
MPTESQLRDTALRLRVRQLIENGELPVMVPEQIDAGYGSGRACVACDRPITSTQVEYEIEDYRDRHPLTFHFGCHVLWRLECSRVKGKHSFLPHSVESGEVGREDLSEPLRRVRLI